MSDVSNEKVRTIYWMELRDDEQRQRIMEWFGMLIKTPGTRATLRRCGTPEEAALVSDTFRVKSILPYASDEAAATIAGILSHVSGDTQINPKSLGFLLAQKKPGSEKPIFSEYRFRQMLSSRDWNELYKSLMRAVKILEGNVSPLILSDFILRWDKEYRNINTVQKMKSVKFIVSKEYYSAIN